MKSRYSRRWVPTQAPKAAILAAVLAMGTLLGGCASTGHERNPHDPAERFNRAMFSFNDKLDKAVLKPVAKGYTHIVPQPGRRVVGNFFSNIDDLFISVNNLLQGKPADSASDMGRFVVNSTIGLLGTMDVATRMGLEKHDEDFGQTLGRWGMADGPYLVLPLFGPSTTRDAFGRVADSSVDPVRQLDDVPWRNGLLALRLVDMRANLFQTEQVLDEVAIDRYEFVRDAYLQRRRYNIYDGNPPAEQEEEDLPPADSEPPPEPAQPVQSPTQDPEDEADESIVAAPSSPAPEAASSAAANPEAAAQVPDAAGDSESVKAPAGPM